MKAYQRLLAFFAIGICFAIIAGGVILSPPRGANATSAPANWVQAGFNRQRTGYNPFETAIGPLNVSQLTRAWGYGALAATNGEPIENNGLLYFSDFNGDLYALNASTGANVWFSAGRGGQNTSPAIANGILYRGRTKILTKIAHSELFF